MSATSFAIKRGRAFLFEGTKIRYTGRARNEGRDYLFVQDDGVQVRLTADELARARERDCLPDWVDIRTLPDGSEMAPLVWHNATAVERARTEWRLEYCMAWAERPQTPRSERGLQPLIAAVHERREAAALAAKRYEPPAPCASSVRKWIADWEAADRVVDALVTWERFRGNRASRFAPRLDELVERCVQKHYLTEERLPVAAVHRKLVKLVKKLNRDSAAPISEPGYDAVRTAVSRLCPFTKDFCRMGAAYAREKWRAVSSGHVTDHPNEVWEVDDTRVDLICTAEDGTTVIGRPWIVVVIDRHTRMIMGFVVTFHPPDTSTAMEAIKQAILSKEDILQRHGLVALGYPASGRPDAIHVDNGKQYNSIALKRALGMLGIQHRTMPVLKAWYRAIVERAIGTLSRQVFHVVAGTTFSGIYERDAETPPDRVAKTTLSELEAKLWRWLVIEYCRAHHKGLEDTPLAVWASYFRQPGHEMRLPLPASDVEAALSLTVARKARKEGLQFKMLIYSSEWLVRLRLRPKSETRTQEVVIRVDRRDLTAIEFLDPVTNQWHPATLRRDLMARVRGRSLEEYELARAMRRNRPGDYEDDPDWSDTYDELDAHRDAAAEDRRLGTRVRAAAERERLVRDAGRLTAPEVSPVQTEDDLSAAIDRMNVHVDVTVQPVAAELAAVAVAAAAVADDAEDDFDPEAWAAGLGLDSRVSKTDAED